MFKIYHCSGSAKKEVKPVNEIYNVLEMGDYEFVVDNIQESSHKEFIFIEDIPINKAYYKIENAKLQSNRIKFFQDFFGFANLTIGSHSYKFNILIEKFKLSEIEDILLFLWQSENKIFDNFFSKSTLKSNVNKNGSDFGLTSKFLVFANHFHDSLKRLLPFFVSNPHTVLRKYTEKTDYLPENVTARTVDWLLTNLDAVKFDRTLSNFPGAIKIEQSYGYVDKIETESNNRSYDVYENQIILGAFVNILSQLKALKQEIAGNVNLNQSLDSDFADFRDLRKIPYLKLFEDSKSIEKKLIRLFTNYKTAFKHSNYKNEKPIVTPVFKSKIHYQLAFKLTKNLRDLKFDFNGELQLLNIKKLSHLYEVYNLHHIVSCFSNKLNLEYFNVNAESSRIDGIMSKISYSSTLVDINIFYELKYPNLEGSTKLIRLDNGYYKPDFIIEILKKNDSRYFILDSKYSFEHTTIDKHLPACIYKYLLNTGIKNEEYKKPNHIVLLYPGESDYTHVEHEFYSPTIKCIVSKPKYEANLISLIDSIIEKEVPQNLYNTYRGDVQVN
ncbi:hypothetical protein AAFN85_05025 [Mucilaginibacter sp. CAU 1740]|uniref:hypothetical protein n=1 Tax=Mucilaginibacter sp. CAU 1740 TaxID=3140365 RepID=UPI00325B2C0C